MMMAVYDLLAPHYDAVTGDSATEAAFIHDIIERRHRQAATLLDLACGTGSITALLAGAYQVSGLDISPACWPWPGRSCRRGPSSTWPI